MLLKNMLLGYYETQCLYTAAKLKIADHLQNGPKSIVDLAKYTNANESKLYRVMCFLSAKNLFDELPGKVFCLNDQSKYLISTAPSSLTNFICLHAEYFYQAASELFHSITNEASAFEIKFGKSAANYFKDNEIVAKTYHLAMKENSELSSEAIADIYDFSAFKTIVDVGAGLGTLVVNILLKYKNACGINFDVPELKNAAMAYYKKMGLAARCSYVGGDFFTSIPPGGDLYIMKAILHGKKDQESIKILENCRAVLQPHGKLLVIERVISKTEENYLEVCLNDMNMLNVTRGHIRTLPEFESIFKKAGYRLTKFYALSDGISIMDIEKDFAENSAS